MHSKLKRNFEKLEKTTHDLILKLDLLPQDVLQQTPRAGKWSITQTLNHILTSERMSLLYMKKKSLGVDQLENSGLTQAFIFRLLQVSQRMPLLKFNAPKPVIQHTPDTASFDEIKRNWQASRSDLKKFLEGIEDRNIRKKIYKHPIVGMLDVVQAVGFLREHLIHHLRQLNKLIAAAKTN
jgi:hypothetical protein